MMQFAVCTVSCIFIFVMFLLEFVRYYCGQSQIAVYS